MIESLSLPTRLKTRTAMVTLRRAGVQDLDALLELLSDNPGGASREDFASDTARSSYDAALARIVASPGNDVLLVTGDDGRVVGTLQLTLIPGMARRGGNRLLVEAVRVRSSLRSGGIGSAMMRWVTHTATNELSADLVQLTSQTVRVDAHRFYERLGFSASHVGFKYLVR